MRRNLSETESATLTWKLGDLRHLDVDQLSDHFGSLYGTEPPVRLRRSLLIRAIAYRLQEKALGGLTPGTTLLREWHGVQHRLTVLEDGVQFGNKRYRSLSEVARKITGSRWSGPLFFGLKSKATEHLGAE